MREEEQTIKDVEETSVEEILAQYQDMPECQDQDEGENLIKVEEV